MLFVREKIYGLKVRHLYSNLPEVIIAAIVLPLVIYLSVQTHDVLMWAALYLIVNLGVFYRTWTLKEQLVGVAEKRELDRFVNQWRFQTYLLGGFWMAFPWVLDIHEPLHFVLAGFMISGVCVGTTVACAAFPRISLVYCTMILGSLFTYLVAAMEYQYGGIAAVTVLFYILVYKMQRTLFSFMNNAFSLTLELEGANEKIQRSHDAAVVSSRLAAQAEMTASFAHEINNPLTVIQFKIMHLRMTMEKGKLTDEAVQAAIEKTLEMVTRIKEIIQSTKKYFYDENEVPELIHIELEPVVREVAEVFSEKCRSRNIKFSCDTINGVEVQGGRTSISQVVTNLLNNAYDSIKADPTGGSIELKYEENQDEVLIHVVDSGQGVPDSLKEKIFEPFYTTKGKGAGLGIGLSICLALIKQMGGNLWLEEGSPSTFSVSFKKVGPKRDTHFGLAK